MHKFAMLMILFIASFVFAMQSSAVSAEQSQQSKNQKNIVVVKSGDSLSKIANRHNTNYQRIFYANTDIKNPNLIYPGDKLRIPGKDEKLKQRNIPSAQAQPQQKQVKNKPTVNQEPVQQNTSQARPAQKPVQAKPQSSANAGVWDRLAHCESTGNWSINTGNGYYGGLQFTLSSWRAVGGTGYPHHASKSEQIARAEKLKAIQGWGAWPACSAKLGLR